MKEYPVRYSIPSKEWNSISDLLRAKGTITTRQIKVIAKSYGVAGKVIHLIAERANVPIVPEHVVLAEKIFEARPKSVFEKPVGVENQGIVEKTVPLTIEQQLSEALDIIQTLKLENAALRWEVNTLSETIEDLQIQEETRKKLANQLKNSIICLKDWLDTSVGLCPQGYPHSRTAHCPL